MDAAADTNFARAADNLDNLIKAITEQFPDAIVEALPSAPVINQSNLTDDTNNIAAEPVDTISQAQKSNIVPDNKETKGDHSSAVLGNDNNTTVSGTDQSIDETKVIIDKSNISQVSFSDDEIDKIKKSRSVTLNIVEGKDIEYSIIKEDDDTKMSDIDTILRQYTRKMNDMRVSLPASKYRCTFTGLSYPEMLDLNYSQELNNIDGERKKWTIVFNHMKNPSIGEFKEYESVDDSGNTITITAFEDFLKKTSFVDLDYALWAILCATCLDKEIVSIDCHSENCNNHYEWTYDPKELIQLDSVLTNTLDEMKMTGEVNTMDDIMKHYNGSMLKLQNTVTLPSSGFVLCFGHVSAYDYLEERLPNIAYISEKQDTMVSNVFEASGLGVIKYILLPDIIDSSKFRKVSDGIDIMKVVHTLDELDCKTIGEIISLMMDPYSFKFSLKNLVCPKCHTRSSIDIDDISRLLFLIAQSLSNSEVKLIRS
jgi:hypothetical protein